jgi:hypothetical protein
MNTRLFSLQNSDIALKSELMPNGSTVIKARVFLFRSLEACSRSIEKELGLLSTNTGFNPSQATEFAVAGKLKSATRISSLPECEILAIAHSSAVVADETATTLLVSKYSLSESSNLFKNLPPVNVPDFEMA